MSVIKKAKIGMFVKRKPSFFGDHFEREIRRRGFSLETVFQISEVNFSSDLIRLSGIGGAWWVANRFDEALPVNTKLDKENLL